jgi:tetratricopeptide (TPR) repeat protein
LLFKAGRRAEALRRTESARAILERLVVEDQSNLDFRSQLVAARLGLGQMRARDGQRDEAVIHLEAARALQETLVVENPKATGQRDVLASIYDQLGRIKLEIGRPKEAITLYEKALAIREGLVRDHPSFAAYRGSLAYTYRGLGRIEAQDGRVVEARRSFERARAIDAERAETLPLSRYNLACDLALCIPLIGRGDGESAPAAESERRRLADEAMHALRLALAAGYPAAVPRRDPDMDPLRSSLDFRLLMMDSAFPADPLARGD